MIIKDEQKVVDYFGMRLTVPNESGYLSTDTNGHVWWSNHCEPVSVDTPHGHWSFWYDAILICTAHLDGMDWRDTLVEV